MYCLWCCKREYFFDSTHLSGDQELGAYSEAFGCAILVTSTDPQAFPVIHGQGPVGFEVEHCLNVDGAGHGAGHFELIRSWLPADWLQRRGFPAVGAQLQDRKRNAPAEASSEESSPEGAAANLPVAASASCSLSPQATIASDRAAVRRRLPGDEAALQRDPLPAKQHLAKRTRTKRRNPKQKSRLCPVEGCCFDSRELGKTAYRGPGAATCMFCGQDAYVKAASTPHGRGSMTRCLKNFYLHKDVNPEVYNRAMANVARFAPDLVEELRLKVRLPKRSALLPAEARHKKAVAMAQQWEVCKAARQPALYLKGARAAKEYRSGVLADQRRATKSFYPDAPRRPRASGDALSAPVDNDCDLPPAFTSTGAIGLQRWCREGAWGMCPNPQCNLLQPRRLTEKDLSAPVATPWLAASACRRCARSKRQLMVPRPQDVPTPLRDLDPLVVKALRPLDIDVGPEVRAGTGGYRKKVRMITFSWCLQSVDAKLRRLPSKQLRRSANNAFRYLLSNREDNEYHEYYSRHRAFLARHREAPTPEQARRPLHFIEQPGLETALWPHLYWRTTMCESFERLNTRRLQQLQGKSAARAQETEGRDSSDEHEAVELDDSDAETQPEAKQSIKRSFQTKVFSSLLGYGSDYELLQYVYDLHLWTDLGSKRNRAGETKMRFMMKGHPMSPLYWENLKFGLFDLVRQLGYPDIYWTLAPWEPSYPYHAFMLDEMQKLLCTRTKLPALEAMHLAHTMLDTCRFYLAGHGRAKQRGWTKHVLGGQLPGRDVNNCIFSLASNIKTDRRRRGLSGTTAVAGRMCTPCSG